MGAPASRCRSRGQGMTEYIIIVALVAIGSIALVSVFGNQLRQLFGMSSDAMSGDTALTQNAPDTKGQDRKNLGNFAAGKADQGNGMMAPQR